MRTNGVIGMRRAALAAALVVLGATACGDADSGAPAQPGAQATAAGNAPNARPALTDPERRGADGMAPQPSGNRGTQGAGTLVRCVREESGICGEFFASDPSVYRAECENTENGRDAAGTFGVGPCDRSGTGVATCAGVSPDNPGQNGTGSMVFRPPFPMQLAERACTSAGGIFAIQ